MLAVPADRRGPNRLLPFAASLRTLLVLACGSLAVALLVEPEFRADSPSYFVYLRSFVFDHDLDFANEWEHWGYPPQERTPTGLRRNYHTVGPAIVWSPFFLLAHCVASLVGSWPADGYSRPYIVAVHAGTLWVFAAGVLALVRAVEKRIGHWDSRLAAVVATGASPAAYYLLVVPAMSHAVVAGLACAFAALWLDARAGRGRWLALGLTAGLLAACRPQTILLTGPFLLALVVTRPPAWTDGVRLGVGGFAGFAPQAVAWWVLFGSPFTLPQGSGFLDLRAPHLLDVLFATDKALFNWVPLAWVALVGSLFGMRRDRIAFAAGLAALGGTAWVNGSVMGLSGPDWAGSDAFGPRRFDLLFPLFVVGLADAFRTLRRNPAVGSALLGAAAIAWNTGLVRQYQAGAHRDGPAPLAAVAAGQIRLSHQVADRVLGALAGRSGRALAYKFFVGQYLYYDLALDGRIDLTTRAGERFLVGPGWGPVQPGDDGEPARVVFHPGACLVLPLQRGTDLRAALTLRKPRKLSAQEARIELEGKWIHSESLGEGWHEIHFVLSASALGPGENLLCLRFRDHLRGPEGGQVAATVRRLQLP